MAKRVNLITLLLMFSTAPAYADQYDSAISHSEEAFLIQSGFKQEGLNFVKAVSRELHIPKETVVLLHTYKSKSISFPISDNVRFLLNTYPSLSCTINF